MNDDLRAAAQAATGVPWSFADGLQAPTFAFVHLASPDRILALCEELERKTTALEAILIRTDEGDARSDWLPIISRLAHAAL